MLRWRMFIEEFDPKICYIEGSKNTCADYFSRVLLDNEVLEEKSGPEATENLFAEPFYQDIIDDDLTMAVFFSECLAECFINIPRGTVYPMSYENIARVQRQCHESEFANCELR